MCESVGARCGVCGYVGGKCGLGGYLFCGNEGCGYLGVRSGGVWIRWGAMGCLDMSVSW